MLSYLKELNPQPLLFVREGEKGDEL